MNTANLKIRFLLISGLCFLLFTIPCQAQKESAHFPYAPPESQGISSEALAELSDIVRTYFDEGQIVGAELAVIKNRHTVFHEAYGWRDREDSVAMERNIIFNIRSMTKPITGSGILRLMDEGKLGLESRAAEFLPGFDNDKSRTITIEQLLTHHSGLPLTILTSTMDFPNLISMADSIGEQGPEFEPGSKFWYSDAGTDVLGAITEAVSGVSLDEFRTKTLLMPLGMKDTFTIKKGDDPRKKRVASLYFGGAKSWRRFWNPGEDPFYPFAWGSQTLYSTPLDYARFLAMWMDQGNSGGKRILSEKTVKGMLTPVSIMSNLGSDTHAPTGFRDLRAYYGQMAILYCNPSAPDTTRPVVISHSGSDGTHAWAWPDLDLMVLYFTQSRGQATGIRLEKDIDRLLIHPGEEPDAAEIPGRFLPYIGNYTSSTGGQNTIMKVLVQNGNLALDIPGQMIFELNDPDEEGLRTFKLTNMVSIGFNEKEGKVNDMLIYETTLLPKKAEADSISEQIPQEYRPYMGSYTLAMAGLTIKVFYQDGRLTLDVPNQGQPFLNPPDDQGIWTIQGDDKRSLSFDRDDSGQVTGMNIHQRTVIPRGMPVSSLIEEIIRSEGLEAAVVKFHEYKKSVPEDYFFSEGSFNSLGYKFLNEKKFQEAITIFRLNLESYPDSWNVYDSLGEAYMKNGNKELSIQNYEKSIAMNPNNSNGKEKLEELKENINHNGGIE